jgi:protocatechuate 3,4-dioxygenase alpha subunit
MRLNTRISFGGEAGASGDDPVLNLIKQVHLRNTLIARADANIYRFKISLQGENETVFFDV